MARSERLLLAMARRHIEMVCRRHRITRHVLKQSALVRSRCDIRSRHIYCPAITSLVNYAVALHEIGHVVVKLPKGVMLSEAAAWVWAHDSALVWDRSMEQLAAYSMISHITQTTPPKRFAEFFSP